MYSDITDFIRSLFPNKDTVPLHEPLFIGNEKLYVNRAIDSTFVSSVGEYVNRFEEEFSKIVGSRYAVATVNGTAALHIALKIVGVQAGDEVITQPLTFVATCNAINYCNAKPLFIDVDQETLGLCPEKLEHFLKQYTQFKEGCCINKETGAVIRACVPMHTFGFPVKIDEIKEICDRYHIMLVEDAAEALGSTYKNQHVGTFGKVSVFSFNGNKIMTTGGGGMIVTDDVELAQKAKHLTTTAKVSHRWEYEHDMLGYNYRMPNINAALGCAQLEKLSEFLIAKRVLSEHYKKYFSNTDIKYVVGRLDSNPNYWLNTIVLKNKESRDEFLEITNKNNIMTRPAWKLMSDLPMYQNYCKMDISNARYFADRLVNIPSTPVIRACI